MAYLLYFAGRFQLHLKEETFIHNQISLVREPALPFSSGMGDGSSGEFPNGNHSFLTNQNWACLKLLIHCPSVLACELQTYFRFSAGVTSNWSRKNRMLSQANAVN